MLSRGLSPRRVKPAATPSRRATVRSIAMQSAPGEMTPKETARGEQSRVQSAAPVDISYAAVQSAKPQSPRNSSGTRRPAAPADVKRLSSPSPTTRLRLAQRQESRGNLHSSQDELLSASYKSRSSQDELSTSCRSWAAQDELSASHRSWAAQHSAQAQRRPASVNLPGPEEISLGLRSVISRSSEALVSDVCRDELSVLQQPSITPRKTESRVLSDTVNYGQDSSNVNHGCWTALFGSKVPRGLSPEDVRSGRRFPHSASVEDSRMPEDANDGQDLLSASQRSWASIATLIDEREEPSKDNHDCQVGLSTCQKSVVTQQLPTASLELELKELKSILEKQYKQNQQLGDKMQPNILADAEQCASLQTQRVHKAASVSPDSAVRELCATVACQQAEQEICLRVLRGAVDTLQQQVQLLWRAKFEKQADDPGTLKQKPKSVVSNGSSPHLEDLQVVPELVQQESRMEEQTTQVLNDLQQKVESMSQQDAALKTWISEFLISALQRTVGMELQRHEEAIKHLNLKVDETSAFTKNSLTSLERMLSEARLAALGEALMNGDAALPHGSGKEQTAAETPRKLHTIVETKSEVPDADSSDIGS